MLVDGVRPRSQVSVRLTSLVFGVGILAILFESADAVMRANAGATARAFSRPTRTEPCLELLTALPSVGDDLRRETFATRAPPSGFEIAVIGPGMRDG